MANNDRVYLAYSGQLGEALENKTKQRIAWILKQAETYEKILDIGCSQGIVSLLLGEKGKKVKGIDIQPEAIEFAQGLLKNEYAHVGERVEFECIDFMLYESDIKYDCIIITEILEHLVEPDKFLRKAASFLKHDGKMIVSVPFGVMIHPDHVSTFYLTNLYNLLRKYLHVYSCEFVKEWMGVTAGLEDNKNGFQINKEAIEAEESNFEIVDRRLNERIISLVDNVREANNKYKKATSDYERIKLMMNEQGEKYKSILAEKEEKYKEQVQKCKEQEMLYTEQKEKCREQEEKCREQEEKCREQEEKCREQEEKYRINLEQQYKDLASTVEIISELHRKMQRLSSQNRSLAVDNEQYRIRLEKIESNYVWKTEIKVYRKLKAIKNKLSRR